MKTKKKYLFALAAALFIGGFSQCLAQSSDNDGVFFKIEGNGLKQSSYILGTIHLIHGDYIHQIPGLDSIINNTECLATELKMEYILHPESVNVTPDLKLSHEDSIRANSLIPQVLADFADTTKSDAYTRYLTADKLDSLDKAFKFLEFDDILKMVPQSLMQNIQGENLYRHLNPFIVATLGRTLLETKQLKKSIQLGYSQDFESMDYSVMLAVNAINEKYKVTNPKSNKSKVLTVGLDSTYAYRRLQESSSGNIKELLKDFSSQKMTNFIYSNFMNLYKTGIVLETADSLYRQGKGKEIVMQMIEAEPTTYGNSDILNGRNKYWMTQIPSIIKTKKTLIAIGLAHLFSTSTGEGILSMLQKQGYKITKLQ